MELTGRSIIGFRQGRGDTELFYAMNPVSGESIQPGFVSATLEEVDAAAQLSEQAFSDYSRVPGREKAAFLRKIASNVEGIATKVIERAGTETALPPARLQGEMARTCGQLRLFGGVVDDGSWTTARIDRADSDRKPLAKPDVRSMLRPLGPVVVFGASNFPLAFSVAGGDTASALAAGNPVIVKAHPAHPGTSELVGRALQKAVRECGLPEGVFSLLFDRGTDVGTQLVKHPMIKAAGFTGSRAAGRALMDVAAARPEPIPFFAEMSSTNPVFILPGALRERRDAIATGLHASFTMGAGQFCTKPGLVFLPAGKDSDELTEKLRTLSSQPARFHMLTSGIRSSYYAGVSDRSSKSKIRALAQAGESPNDTGFCASAALFATDVRTFLNDGNLADEIFGPATLLVERTTPEAVLEVARKLDGHLTATIHGTDEDLRQNSELIALLERKVGRLIFNGFPTGVEVCHAMVHGGPYPATSDGRFTSVGTQAIFRFARPVCYQGFPDHALPEELQDANPLGIWRMVDGKMTRESVSRSVAA